MNQHGNRMQWRVGLLGVALAALAGSASAQVATKGLVDDKRLVAANDTTDADWITFGQDYRNNRFSALTQIDKTNVGKLQLAWIYQLGTVGSTQAQPLVVDGVMYVTAPNCDVIALTADGGEEIWRYRHKFTTPRAVSNRGAAVGYGKVYEATDDHRVIALDQATGKVLWDKDIPGFTPPDSLNMPGKKPGTITYSFRYPPLVYDGMVIVSTTSTGGTSVQGLAGNAPGGAAGGFAAFAAAAIAAGGDVGAEYIQANLGARGFMVALDANTGAEKWRFYFTPETGWEGAYATVAANGTQLVDRDVAAEKALAPLYKNAWAAGGTTGVWAPAVDPSLGILYAALGNPGGDIPLARPGDNLYSNSLVAIDAKTGTLKWYMQIAPHTTDDDVLTQATMLDVMIDGRKVPAVGTADKAGYYYVADRATGKLLFSSQPIVPQMNLFRAPTIEGIVRMPGGAGGASVSPHSFDPNTGLLYIAELHRASGSARVDLPTAPGRPTLWYTMGAGTAQVPTDSYGVLTALDMNAKGKIVWQTKTKEALVGGVVATAGGLVFAGEANGHFNAYDAATGTQLWTFQTGANNGASVASYAVGGKQYVAMPTGAAAPADGVAIAPGALRPGGAVMAFTLPR